MQDFSSANFIAASSDTDKSQEFRTVGALGEYRWSGLRCIPQGGHQMSLVLANHRDLPEINRVPTCSSRNADGRMASRSKS
jgi:hypothetical protein